MSPPSASLSPADLPARAAEALSRFRAQKPRVHALTSGVAENITANALLALGATPSMTRYPIELPDFLSQANALLINLGGLNDEREKAILAAVKIANVRNLPWALDPVFADVSSYRKNLTIALLDQGPRVLKANSRESVIFKDAPAKTLFVTTGAIDRIQSENQTFSLENGHAMAARVTGTGCALGAIIAGFLAVTPDARIAAAAGLGAFAIASSRAAIYANGPGSFSVALLDELSYLTPEVLRSEMKPL